jgi:hypothetical protein
MMRLASNRPVRPLKPAHRALTGRVVLNTGKTAGYESSLERDWLMALDFDWRVQRLQEQPYSLSYTLDEQRRRYTPDILAEFNDGIAQWTVVYEVKSHDDLKENWQTLRPRYKAALKDCSSRGWKFRIVTERDIRTVYVSNAKFLRRFRDIPAQEMHLQALLYSLPALGQTTPQALLAATWGDTERRMAAIPELWRLIADRKIGVSLHEPLTMATKIWML